jgi:DNA repair protein RadC
MEQLTMLQVPKLKRMAKDQAPAYRIQHLGPQVCSWLEVLAAVVGGPNQLEIAERIAQRYPSSHELAMASHANIERIKGVGSVTASRIMAAVELGRRFASSPKEKVSVSDPSSAAAIVQYELGSKENEELWVMALDTRNNVMNINKLYRGSVNSSQVRIGEIFRDAIRINAANIIMFHNHPSGDPTPSSDDIRLTSAIVSSGRTLDIELLDHIIIGHGSFVSLKERGLGFR